MKTDCDVIEKAGQKNDSIGEEEFLRNKTLILKLLDALLAAQGKSVTDDSPPRPNPPVSLPAFRSRRASLSSTSRRTKP